MAFLTRRRKLLFTALAITAGGYASYKIYHSAAFARRRKQLAKYMNIMSFLGDAVSEGAESMSIVFKDLKIFLSSDQDTVPRSLRQAFKIGQCHEFQETVAVLSAALARGLIHGISANQKNSDKGSGNYGERLKRNSLRSFQVKDTEFECEDIPLRDIKEVRLAPDKEEINESRDFLVIQGSEHDIKYCNASGSNIYVKSDEMRMGQKDSKFPEDLSERLLSTLFSDAGTGFASAVAGAVARNFVLAFLDAVNNQSNSKNVFTSKYQHGASSSLSSNDEIGVLNLSDINADPYLKFLNVMSTTPCKALIADCIQTFVSTAVTIYVDKTKDVNFYNDMVAGITNPSHKDPMKDLMSTVCNGAIETFVRTSYDIMFEERKKKHEIEEYAPESTIPRQLLSSPMENRTEDISAIGNSELISTGSILNDRSNGTFKESLGGMNSVIEGISRTLAIPSNRKLVVDVAGKMTSEAVRSFVNVVVSTAGSHFRSKTQRSWEKVKRSVSARENLQLRHPANDLAVKTFVLASICLAIFLHIFTGLKLSVNG